MGVVGRDAVKDEKRMFHQLEQGNSRLHKEQGNHLQECCNISLRIE